MTSKDEIDNIANKAFSIIELVEVSGISQQSFLLIRKKLLNLGNDIKRLSEKVGEK